MSYTSPINLLRDFIAKIIQKFFGDSVTFDLFTKVE